MITTMNADEVVKGLQHLSGVLRAQAWHKARERKKEFATICSEAANLIESLQAQLAEAQRRAEAQEMTEREALEAFGLTTSPCRKCKNSATCSTGSLHWCEKFKSWFSECWTTFRRVFGRDNQFESSIPQRN